MSLVKTPRLLTTLSAQCYIKYKANSLEDEFYRTFVHEDDSNDDSTTVQTPPASSDLMSKYEYSIYIVYFRDS